MRLARALFLTLFFVFISLTIMSIEGPYQWFPIGCAVISILCFGIAYLLDWVLWENGDHSSPFYHE